MFGQGFNSGFLIVPSGVNTFASENFNTVLYTGTGASQRIGGYINKGAVFNGSANITTLLDFSSLTDYSISMWLFVLAAPSTTKFFAGTIQNSGALNGIYLAVETDGDIRFYERNASGSITSLVSTDSITFNSWNHIVAVRNGSTNYLYINNGTPVSASNSTITHATDFTIGRAGAYTTNPIDGKIDQVRIFDKAISSSEITTLYGETYKSTKVSTTDIFGDNSGVALYKLDGNANDTGGTSGKFGAAAIYSGNNGNITINNFPTLTQVGISMWVNIPDISAQFALISRYGLIGSTDDREFSIYTYQGTLYAIIYYNGNNGNAVSISTSSYLSNNTWHHIAFTSDGSTQPKLYIDGVQRGTAQSNNNSYYSSSQPVLIGAFSASSAYNLTGRIDQVRIYDTALSSTDVSNLYAETASNTSTLSFPSGKTAIATYKLDGNSTDLSGKYDGTDTNITYAYDGTATNVTYQEATNFQPDLVWVKKRDGVHDHKIADSVRGATKIIESSTTDAEITATGSINAFHTNGFAVGSDSSVNGNGNDFVAWCFKGGGTAVSNTDGSIASSVSANQDAGFSIVKYTSNGSYTSSDTIGHGLSQAPELVIWKPYETTTSDWFVQYELVDGSVDYLLLNEADAKRDSASTYLFQSNVLVNYAGANGQDTIAYCFHSVDGYSKIGSYTGTGVAGNMVETGFEPAWIMIKQTNTSGSNWNIIDNKRDTVNPREAVLWADTSDTESTASQSGAYDVNFLSNGFSLENTYQPFNASGGTYIYLAIATDPDTSTPTVENSFDTVTYIGTGSAGHKINTDFKPDLVWIKNRDAAVNHKLLDSIRHDGTNIEVLEPNTTSASSGTTQFSSFDSDGFTLGGSASVYNGSGVNYVAWCWKAGDHNNSLPQINTNGTIDSIVSVNVAAGFSIVKYKGTASVGATVGHGLSSAPELYIIKETSAADDWMAVAKIGSSYQRAKLQTTDAFSTAMSGVTNNVDPTSAVITLGNSNSVNQSGQDYIGYFFHSVTGHSKVGSYSGGSTNTIVTGFKPSWIMVKRVSSTGSWNILDNKRGGDSNNNTIYANDAATESTHSDRVITFESNGFSWNATTSGNVNLSGHTYVYMAFK